MKKIFLFITVSCTSAIAQQSMMFEKNYPDRKSCIGIAGDYGISSNAITAAFDNAWIQGKFIDKDLKDGSLEKLDDDNLLGSHFNAGIYYRHYSEKVLGISNAHYFFSAMQRSHFNTAFPGDLFQLYFYGNAPFAGRTADISDFNYQALQYQQLQFGIIKEVQRQEKSFGYSIALAALNGQSFLKIKTGHGSLFTEQEAKYIDMDMELEAEQSDTSHTSFGSSNGIGASLDLGYFYTVEDKFSIRFSVNDLGMIAWNSHSQSYVVDTSYHFEGVNVSDLLDSIYLDLKSEQDFKEGFIKNREEKSITTWLPVRLNLSFEKILTPGKLSIFIGGEYMLNADFTPLFFAGGNYFFSNVMNAGIRLQYGGYGGFHAGIQFNRDFGKGFIINLGTNYLDGFIVPNSSTSQGAFAGVKKIF